MSEPCPVNSWNDFDPLEEVIVGTPWGAFVHDMAAPIDGIPESMVDAEGNLRHTLLRAYEGTPYPPPIVIPAMQQIERFVAILRAEGVTVRRPDPFPLHKKIVTPFWEAQGGYNFMNPRDLVLVLGDQLIETATPLRKRYFETFAYRRLFKEYFHRGARWVSAPKPELLDQAYDLEGIRSSPKDPDRRFMTSEYEPVFDAASFCRCGRDIFAVRDHVTNNAGIEWLERHLGDGFRMHVIDHKMTNAIHIDDTFVPLAPGKALVNPEWAHRLPDVLKTWDLLMAPPPDDSNRAFLGFQQTVTDWISLNVFSIDHERVFVEEQQVSLIKKLEDWGFTPIPLPYTAPPLLGGGFHCTTLDIRRRGELQSYF